MLREKVAGHLFEVDDDGKSFRDLYQKMIPYDIMIMSKHNM